MVQKVERSSAKDMTTNLCNSVCVRACVCGGGIHKHSALLSLFLKQKKKQKRKGKKELS